MKFVIDKVKNPNMDFDEELEWEFQEKEVSYSEEFQHVIHLINYWDTHFEFDLASSSFRSPDSVSEIELIILIFFVLIKTDIVEQRFSQNLFFIEFRMVPSLF